MSRLVWRGAEFVVIGSIFAFRGPGFGAVAGGAAPADNKAAASVAETIAAGSNGVLIATRASEYSRKARQGEFG